MINWFGRGLGGNEFGLLFVPMFSIEIILENVI